MEDYNFLLALEYSYLTEQFDASMSPIRDDKGVAVIQGPNHGLCIRHAVSVRDAQIQRERITYEEWRKIVVYPRYIFDEMGIEDLIKFMKKMDINPPPQISLH